MNLSEEENYNYFRVKTFSLATDQEQNTKMASAMRGEKCERSRIRELVLILSLITMAGDSRATPFDPSFFIEGVQSEVVNPFNRTILNRFNLTEEQILSIQNRSNPNMRDDSAQSSNQQYLQQVATQR